MASGSSGRDNSGSKGFDFGSDDILCSYEDYGNQEGSNGSHSDRVIGTNSAKEFHKSRMARSSLFPTSSCSPPEESFNQDVISTVEKTMKKYADNLMRFLEGISSRLSQLELYCYNLDKSIGEMRSDLVRDHGEADSKLKSLEKHVQEVHRSVQILRDKQELAETQKELAKLQLAQKESFTATHSQQNEERAAPPVSDPKRTDKTSDVHSQQLALALPHQVAPQQPSLPTRPVEQQQPVAPLPATPPQNLTQSQAYYLPPTQIPNPPAPTQPSQGQYLPSDSQYRTPQMQDISRVAPQPTQSQVNQTPQIHPLPQYQQQWPQQLPQQVQPPQQPSMQPQIRPPSTAVYPSYLPSQPANPSPSEMLPNSMSMQVPFSGISQPGATRAETMAYGYGGAGRTQPQPQPQPQPPSQQLKVPFGVQPSGDGYTAAGPHPILPPGNAYMMYEGEAGRTHHPSQPHFPQGGYPPTSVPFQNPQPNASANLLAVRPPQFMRNHPYNELIEKLVNMGYRGDHVVSVIQRLEESGQPVDFNAVLDRLNVHSSGGSQRGWSG
uniref:Putative extensin-like n=1 Tax=Davidia involucrata TaxID=16924 RepID=A0A5B6ZZL3_DAVIN